MFLWTGLDQGCLRDHFRRARDLKMKENKRFYGFTDFRGKPARRGRERHASENQVTAGDRKKCWEILKGGFLGIHL